MSEKDGGPAFPQELVSRFQSSGNLSGINVKSEWLTGMSLRDYFAGQALTAAVTRASISQAIASLAEVPFTEGELAIANTCYRIADAMLKERAK